MRTTTKRPLTWLTLLLAAALLVAGCGSSSTSGSNSTSGGQGTSTAAATQAPATTAPTTSTAQTTPGIAKSAIRKLAERTCRSQIQAELALTSAERGKLEKLCSKAGTSVEATRAITRQVCVEIVKHAALPGSPQTPARKQAIAACNSAK